MENVIEIPSKAKRKQWRSYVKKIRRKKLRQRLAKERSEKLAEEESAKLLDPEYQKWLKDQEELEKHEREVEEQLANAAEERWLRRELLAQKHFRAAKEQENILEAEKEVERQRIQKEYEEMREKARQRQLEREQKKKEAANEFEQFMNKIYAFLENGTDDDKFPEELKRTAESHPGREECPHFKRTNCCRFGQECKRNHIRPMVARILFIRHFYVHIGLEQHCHTEYDSDIGLEFTDDEMQNDYASFFSDIVSEFEKFGEIENVRTTCNHEPYLRGHVFVEYQTVRAALNAFIQLQGRYYASRQLNVEFSTITSWRAAICGTFSCIWPLIVAITRSIGLSLTKKCPKGRNCNFPHIFANPGNKYNKNVYWGTPRSQPAIKDNHTPSSWDDDCKSINGSHHRRNWRWSESPEFSAKSSCQSEKSSRRSKMNKDLCSTRRLSPHINYRTERRRRKSQIPPRPDGRSKSDKKKRRRSKSSDERICTEKSPKRKSSRSRRVKTSRDRSSKRHKKHRSRSADRKHTKSSSKTNSNQIQSSGAEKKHSNRPEDSKNNNNDK